MHCIPCFRRRASVTIPAKILCLALLIVGLLPGHSIAQPVKAPIANDDSYSGASDTVLSVAAPGVLANDQPVNGKQGRDRLPLSVELVTGAGHGSLDLGTDGSFTYTPDAGFAGADSFSYQAYDGVATSNAATVSLTIGSSSGANQPPVAVDDDYSVTKNSQLSVGAPGVLGNDSDPDNDPLIVDWLSSTSNGALSLNADGSFTYMPDNDFVGTDSFTYRVDDGSAYSNSATVTVTVTDISATAPTANPDYYEVDEYSVLSVGAPGVLSNDSKANVKGRTAKDRSALQTELVRSVDHGILDLYADGGLTYWPESGFIGNDSFEYRVFDGVEYSAATTVTIGVLDVNFPPSISGTPDTLALPGAPYVFVPSASDPDNDVLTFSATSLPQWLTIDTATGEISGVASAADIGIYSGIVLQVSDGEYTSSLPLPDLIVPAAVASSFTLNWVAPTENTDGTPLTDLEGFNIYYWDVDPYESTVIDAIEPYVTSYYFQDFATGLWKLAITAYNADGTESLKSVVLPILVQ